MTTLMLALLWQTVAVAAVAAVADWALRRQAAAARHAVMVTALLLAVALPFATVALRVRTHWLKATPFMRNVTATPAHSVPASLPAAVTVPHLPRPAVPAWPGRAARWLTGIFCLFAGLRHLAALTRRWRRTGELCRAAVPDRVVAGIPVLRTAEPVGPFTVGLLRPLIVVPGDILQAEDPRWLAAALAHELAHVRRRDYAWALLCELAVTPLAFHPGAQWMLRKIAETREMACDEVAARVVPGYAGTLVAIAGQIAAGVPLVGLCLARRTSFERRIRALAAGRPRRSAAAVAAALGGLAMASVSAWALGGGLQPAAPQPPPSWAGAGPGATLSRVPPAHGGETPRQQAATHERSAAEEKWLNEDVAYIITQKERDDFLKLTSAGEREKFIEQFWERRNPDPGSNYNPYKEEHYRRLAYANEHFSTPTLAGWRTDRGRSYITFGPPNSITVRDGGSHAGAPSEEWIYDQLPGIGTNIKLDFVDSCRCGEFTLITS